MVDSARLAIDDLKKSAVGIATGKAERIGFNRRYRMKDGSIIRKEKEEMHKRYERARDSLNNLSLGLSYLEYRSWLDKACKARDKYILKELSTEEAIKNIKVLD